MEIKVANISDNLILGLDFLQYMHAVVNLNDYSITIGKDKIPINTFSNNQKTSKLCQLKLEKKLVIEPKSTVQLPAKMSEGLQGNVIIQPSKSLKGLAMPYILTENNTTVPITLKNLTDKHVYLKRDTELGTAMEIDYIVQDDTPSENEIRQVNFNDENTNLDHSTTIPEELPSHLQDLFTRSKQHLTTTQSAELAKLLIEFKDTFAKDDFDLGHFTQIKHRIDTGNSAPVREKMRRTPFGFEEEEEKHIQQLLDKKIIQPSASEWAAAPVLVGKETVT